MAVQPDATDSHEALMQFLYRAPVGLVQAALDGRVEMMNPMAAQLLMPLAPDGQLDNLFDVLAGVAPGLRAELAAFGPGSGTVCEALRLRLPTAAPAPQVLSLSLVKLDAGQLMAMVSDATQEALREQQGLVPGGDGAARLDALTRMPGRAAAREFVAQALARAEAEPGFEFALLYLNCDRFRQINDAHGRAAGDEVLGLIADRLRSMLRRRARGTRGGADGPLAARLEGDEFVVVLDDLHHADDVHAVARRLLDALGQPISVRGRQLHCSASLGIVTREQAQGSPDQLLQDASVAMVEAKRAGGARYVLFEPAMQERASRRGSLEGELRRALAEGQLFLAYQPVVGLLPAPSGAAGVDWRCGVEALVRWQHPQRGVVPPDEFIGLAEECGLIGALGEFVLATACRQFMDWQQTLGDCAPRMLAVNLSRGQLVPPGFVDAVSRILQDCGMAPAQLQLEVTESLAAQDQAVQAELKALKALGLTLALDDFGTGYSSLASLHLLPVDTVKIDRSFVSEAVTSEHHRVLIEATVRVARSLGMGTVAEGIESAAQADVVRHLGCEKAQGYAFSRPLAAPALAQWLLAAPEALPPAAA